MSGVGGNDGRVEAAGQALYREQYRFLDSEDRADLEEQITTILAAADAADSEAGVHRVKVDDATVERVFAVVDQIRDQWRARPEATPWDDTAKAKARRAVLAALTGSES